MDYIGRTPAPPLNRYIDDVYWLTGRPRHRRLNVPPMPSAHLFVNLGEPILVQDGDHASPAEFASGWFMGARTRRVIVEYPSQVRILGVHFKPWGMSPFLDLPPAELRDRWVPADAVWGADVDRLRDRVASATSPGEILQTMEHELWSRLDPSPRRGFQLVHQTAGHLADSWGAVSVGALAERAGISSNHLTSQFKLHVGVTPKRVARIYRFARLILAVDASGPVDWSDLAYVSGYFDQAHLCKEFKDFTGHTPTEYVTLRRRYPAQDKFPPDNGPMPVE